MYSKRDLLHTLDSESLASLHSSRVAYQACSYLVSVAMKGLGVLPLDGILVYHRIIPSIKLILLGGEKHRESKVSYPRPQIMSSARA